ncbi:MAG: glucosamine-6-phosphate deaminase [Candidatus Woesearchaeota archaeon]
MKIIKTKDYNELSKKASDILIKEIAKKPNVVIGFASGFTPLGLYKILIKKKTDFSKIKSFNLDELYPIKKSDKKSYSHYMFKNLFNHVNIKKSNINLLNGETKNPTRECLNYEKKIKKNKIDIQILGLGANGHIAFNEPGSKLNSRTRLVNLSKETKKSKKISKRALTVGIKTILSAKKLILLASGNKKAKAVRCLVKGSIGKGCPASYLRKHKNFILIMDKGAGSLL